MGTATVFLVIGEEDRYHGGIIPEKILVFYENDIPCWFDLSDTSLITSTYEGWQLTRRIHRSPPHTPESPEFNYIITDALLRYGMEYSEKKEELYELKRSLEEKFGNTFEKYMERLDINIERRDCRFILEKMRKTLENSWYTKKLVVFCLKGSPYRSIRKNIERLNAKYEIAVAR